MFVLNIKDCWQSFVHLLHRANTTCITSLYIAATQEYEPDAVHISFLPHSKDRWGHQTVSFRIFHHSLKYYISLFMKHHKLYLRYTRNMSRMFPKVLTGWDYLESLSKEQCERRIYRTINRPGPGNVFGIDNHTTFPPTKVALQG